MKHVFVAGATGFIGTALVAALVREGHSVTALVRNAAVARTLLPPETAICQGDPLVAESFRNHATGHDTFVQLVGVAHPNPLKAKEFGRIDGEAGRIGADICKHAGIGHYVYMSVPQPLPVMQAYGDVRRQVEEHTMNLGIAATFVRPFYVLGPGRRWPFFLYPMINGMQWASRTARRMALVTRGNTVQAMLHTIVNPPSGIRILEGAGITRAARNPLI